MDQPLGLTIAQGMFALIQAASAGLIAYYTVKLARATTQYARTTDKQLEEIKSARLAGLQPYVHVVQAETSGAETSGGTSLKGLTLRLSLANMGPGPALSLRAYTTHKYIKFGGPMLDPRNLGPHQRVDDVILPEVTGIAQPPSGQTMPGKVGLRLEYRDIAGRYWKTTLRLKLRVATLSPGGYSCDGVTVLDQTECVDEIDKPYIRQDTFETLREIDKDLDVGTIGRPAS